MIILLNQCQVILINRIHTINMNWLSFGWTVWMSPHEADADFLVSGDRIIFISVVRSIRLCFCAKQAHFSCGKKNIRKMIWFSFSAKTSRPLVFWIKLFGQRGGMAEGKIPLHQPLTMVDGVTGTNCDCVGGRACVRTSANNEVERALP